jgi:hypothetical protein
MKIMKRFIKFKGIVLAIFFLAAAFQSTFAVDPTVTLNYNATGLAPGVQVSVPVLLNSGTNNVGSWQMYIKYNRNILRCDTLKDFWGGLAGGLTNQNRNYLYAAGDTVIKVGFVYFGGSGNAYVNQQIFNIYFTPIGIGSTTITFYHKNEGTGSYVKAPPTTFNFSTTWIDGSASVNPEVITSKVTGGNWNVAGTWDQGHVPNYLNSVIIASPPANPVIVTANATASLDLTINAGGALTLNNGITLTVGGNLLIKSDATGSGSFVDLGGTFTVTGTTSVQRYMTGNWTSGVPTGSTTWHYIASPISGGVINTFLGDLLNKYNEPAQQWDSLTLPVTTPLIVGKGYSAAPHTPGGLRIFGGGGGNGSGALNTGNITMSGLTNTASGVVGYRGYNLLGNSYPSALKWDNTWSMSNVDATAWVWDPTVGHYWSNDGTTGTGPFVNGIIPAEQGFFVHVSSTGTGSVTIPNGKRQHSTQTYYKEAVSNLINLKLEGNNGYDETVVFFNSNATAGYDNNFDSYKLFAGTPVTEIYSVIGGNTEASINVLPDFQTSTMIPVGIRTGESGSYTLTASQMESFPSGTLIFLEDLMTPDHHTFNLIENPVYTFTSDAVNVIRFNLHFFPVGIPETGSGKIRIYSNLKDVYVNIPSAMTGNIVIYNLLGSELANRPIQANTLNRITLNSPTGYYIVKVIGDSGITTGKVFIQ